MPKLKSKEGKTVAIKNRQVSHTVTKSKEGTGKLDLRFSLRRSSVQRFSKDNQTKTTKKNA